MISTNAPHILWDYCMELVSLIRSHTALDIVELGGDTPMTALTGDTPDISHLCEFSWYDMVWFVDVNDQLQNRKLARYLGPSHDIGQALTSKLLVVSGKEISRTSVIPFSVEDKNNPVVKEQVERFNADLTRVLGDRARGIDVGPYDDDLPEFEEAYADDDSDEIPPLPESDEVDYNQFHRFISARVMIPVSGELRQGTVVARKRDDDGKLIGRSHKNPLLDTSMYDVEFQDGITEAFTANTVAEAIFAQIDDEGNEFNILADVIDHKKTSEALQGDDNYVTHNGKQYPKQTTKGWSMCVQWRDGSTSWVRLVDLKESNPVEVAEYALANKLLNEPAFSWWAPYILRKRQRIIAKIKSRYSSEDCARSTSI